MSDCCGTEARNRQERILLWIVLVLNGVMFFVEFIAAWLAHSSGLMADSLDMLADTLVYAVSLYAVGKGLSLKAKAAFLNGSLQMILGIGVFIHIAWRIWEGSTPSTHIMGWIAGLALLVNVSCFALLYRFRSGDVNMRASWICSRNDMLANAGVILAAGLVQYWSSPWPDYVIAVIIAGIVVRSSYGVLVQARASLKQAIEEKAGTASFNQS
ncbi:Cadmium, cobalt and zinc/H(+)-K(+) antiporter [Zhongshania aliphaticivorans]|uniref:Cadmium, cobalt and zinc/H(+)-K(+) antiporter n=1 Tax=Zhongshania aliphaticivorans TaxID=1470434 RepID=A0A5S9NLW1_9GAMM|nr:cation diffusion facilitator family transporter [Zhongshania aliphaticivorans]CAA0090027.1 Cadmium, cobalt and zinc/H(+)-K(+) antiporter [Zhongshania aliphaticivorans]CAA0097258.1 Cadmium, cobalt and zinc/H(+)-K(+) antiporter [Zhongshania aliphaticivorans]